MVPLSVWMGQVLIIIWVSCVLWVFLAFINQQLPNCLHTSILAQIQSILHTAIQRLFENAKPSTLSLFLKLQSLLVAVSYNVRSSAQSTKPADLTWSAFASSTILPLSILQLSLFLQVLSLGSLSPARVCICCWHRSVNPNWELMVLLTLKKIYSVKITR